LLKEWDRAAVDYETALKLRPNNVWLETALTEAYLEANKLDDALHCLERLTQSNLNDGLAEVRLATVQLLKGDQGGYQATCERMLARNEGAKSPAIANNTAWACALGPRAVKDMNRAVRLAQQAVELDRGNGEYLNTLGAVSYRADQFEDVIRLLRPSASPSALSYAARSNLTALYDRLFLAMALFRSGRAEEASELLDLVDQQLATAGRSGTSVAGVLRIDPWQLRELHLLRDEARKLIKPTK
jgi:tetratricopeptide (TPR) repeat protein